MNNNAGKKQFDSLYQQYRPMVLQMCRGYMKGDDELAEDLTQEVFINVWNALHKFKGNSSYKTWIYRITVNSCLNYIRNKKESVNIPLDSVDLEKTDDTELQKTVFTNLYSAIGRLPEIERLIIMMVLDENNYDEIAEVMGISAGNVRVKIHRIKKNLKKYLNDAN